MPSKINLFQSTYFNFYIDLDSRKESKSINFNSGINSSFSKSY